MPLHRVGGTATYAPWAGGTKIPERAPIRWITTFQAGHGWVLGGAAGASGDDASQSAIGTQSYRVTTNNAGGTASIRKDGMAAFDMTNKAFAVLLRIDNPAGLTQLVLTAGDTTRANNFSFAFQSGPGGDDYFTAGEFVLATIPWRAPSVTGTPNRAAITDVLLGVRDKSGSAVNAHVQAIGIVDDPALGQSAPVVSFEFDDGYATTRTVAAPQMAKYDWRGVCYPIVGRIGSSATWMTAAQVQQLQNKYGWTIGVHANDPANHDAGFTTLTAAQQRADLIAAKVWLRSLGLAGDAHFAIPRGMFNKDLLTNARELFASSRTTYSRSLETWPPADNYKIRAISIQSSTTLAAAKAEVDSAAAGRYWLIFIFHDLVTGTPTGNQWPQADFRSLVDYTATKAVTVRSIAQLVR